MHIALYSERARQPIVAARDMIADMGFPATTDAIRQFRQHVMTLPDTSPVKEVTEWLDFMTTSACRDLLFHVREHRFTLPQIEEILKDLGLCFIGFEFPRPDTLRRYREAFPDDPTATSLANWHRFEEANPRLFSNTYPMWLRKQP